ncbi:hypothetical protein BY996DRAFT_6550372 [Phakopsora pachyrhizi]|nr:hypothetical protein BY996DRAFT_6550372 [Phakopsora pachyrhizi]
MISSKDRYRQHWALDEEAPEEIRSEPYSAPDQERGYFSRGTGRIRYESSPETYLGSRIIGTKYNSVNNNKSKPTYQRQLDDATPEDTRFKTTGSRGSQNQTNQAHNNFYQKSTRPTNYYWPETSQGFGTYERPSSVDQQYSGQYTYHKNTNHFSKYTMEDLEALSAWTKEQGGTHVFKDLDLTQSVQDQAGPISGKLTPNSNLKDLIVLGKADFMQLLKWRVALRELLGIEEKSTVGEAPDKDVAEPLDKHFAMEQEKWEQRRLNEKRAWDVQQMQPQMTMPMDIGLEHADNEIFGLMNMENHELSSDREILENYNYDENSEVNTEDLDKEKISDQEIKLNALEESFGKAYDDYQENQLRKDDKKKAREEALKHIRPTGQRSRDKAAREEDNQDKAAREEDVADARLIKQKQAQEQELEWNGTRKHNNDDDNDSDSDGEDVTQQAERIMAAMICT